MKRGGLMLDGSGEDGAQRMSLGMSKRKTSIYRPLRLQLKAFGFQMFGQAGFELEDTQFTHTSSSWELTVGWREGSSILHLWGWNPITQKKLDNTLLHLDLTHNNGPCIAIKKARMGDDRLLVLDMNGDLFQWIWTSGSLDLSVGQLVLGDVVDFDCSGEHVIAISDGALWSWGIHAPAMHVMLGRDCINQNPCIPARIEQFDGERITTQPVFVAVACSRNHNVVLTKNHQVFTWGFGMHGQLGHGSIDSVMRPRHVSFFVGDSITQIDCGLFHSVFLSETGAVYTCGWDDMGQLGQGSAPDRGNGLPGMVEFGDVDIVRVASGACHVLCVDTNGQLWGWGSNKYGQLGLADEEMVNIPTRCLPNCGLVHDISAGVWHSTILCT